MLYFNNIVRFRKWKLFLILGLFSIALGLKVVLKTLRLTPSQLTDLQKCPACYGLSICDAIFNDKISIRHKNAYATFANLFASKNVFYGYYGRDKIVIKKLAHTNELDLFDKFICNDKNLAELCPNHNNNNNNKNNNKKKKEISLQNVDFYSRIIREITSDFTSENISNLRLCPIHDHVDDLFSNVYANNFVNNEKKQITYSYLWTMIKINPEPLVLQILPSEEGWPVPKYFGACGRLVIEEYVGPTLSNYYYEPWLRRAKIASSLLEAAQMFTYRNPYFGFYLTDVSPDNIAVDQLDNAKFIDMENIIVVDKRISENNKTSDWDNLEVNDADFNCRNCLAFSPIDICAHRHSDHNYYAVCQHLLAPGTSSSSIPGGFLHNVPMDILNQYPKLSNLLRECAVPNASKNRIVVGDILRELLNEIVEKNVRPMIKH